MPDAAPLEAFLTGPNGGQVPRCQAHKKSGEQCGGPAVSGYRVCSKHGAGTKVRVERGERKPAGRPPEHGLYSKSGLTNIQELMERVLGDEAELDNSDRELAALKAVLWHLLEQSERYETYVQSLDKAMEYLGNLSEAAADEQESEAGAAAIAREIGGYIQQAAKMQMRLDTWAERLMKSAEGIIDASKKRAETKAKLAETKALEHFVRLMEVNRNIMWDLLDDEQIDVFEDRLMRELAGPNRISLPVRTLEARSDG